MAVKTIKVTEGNKEREVIIAMTDDEARDRSYADYVELAARETTANELRKSPQKTLKHSKQEIAGALKDLSEYRRRRESEHPRKYW